VILTTAVKGIFRQSSTRERDAGAKVLDLITHVSASNQMLVGSRGTVLIAMIAVEYPFFSEITGTCLEDHVLTFTTVARSDQAIFIGTVDGMLYTLRRNRHWQHKMLSASQDVVLRDPAGRFVG
jgi:hypothetical protein